MKDKLNVMPAPTWNHLKVNASDLELFNISSDIKPFKNVDKNISENIGNYADEAIFKNIKGSVGDTYTKFIDEHNNDSNNFIIDKPSDNLTVLDYKLSENEDVLIDKTNIYVKSGSKATIIQKYTSLDNGACKHAGQTKIFVEKEASICLIQVQMLNDNSRHFSDIGISLDENASAYVVRAEMGSKDCLVGCTATLEGKRSNFEIDTVYYGDEERHLDFNDVARHIGKKTGSIIKAQGALFDNCKKIYRGTIDFIRGSKQSVGDESENTMVFSPKCINKSAPLILCEEDDVEGHHAASIGRIDEGIMFYMQTRGLSKEEVRKLMIESNFAPTLDKIPDEDIRSQILDKITNRISNK